MLFVAPVPPVGLYEVADPVTWTRTDVDESARDYAPMGADPDMRGLLPTRPTVSEVIYDEPDVDEGAADVEERSRLVLGLRGRESEGPSAEERVGNGSGYGEPEQVGRIGPDQVVRRDSGSSEGSLTWDPAKIPESGADTSGRRGNFNKKPIFLNYFKWYHFECNNLRFYIYWYLI